MLSTVHCQSVQTHLWWNRFKMQQAEIDKTQTKPDLPSFLYVPSLVSMSSSWLELFFVSFSACTWLFIILLGGCFCGVVTGLSRLGVEEFLLDTVTFTCLLAIRPISADNIPLNTGATWQRKKTYSFLVEAQISRVSSLTCNENKQDGGQIARWMMVLIIYF